MASLWHLLFMILSSLLLVAGYQLPILRFLFQDGTSEGPMEEHGLRVQSELPLGAPGWWEWKTGGDVHRELPQRPHRKRRASNHTSTPATTQTLHNNTGPKFNAKRASISGISAPSTTPPDTKVITEADTTEGITGASPVTTEMLVEDDTTEGTTGKHPVTTDSILKANTTEDVMSTGTILPEKPSLLKTERPTVVHKGKIEVTTDKGPLMDTTTPRTLVDISAASTMTPRQSTDTAGPHLRAKATVRGVLVTGKVTSSIPTTVPAKPPSQMSPPISNLVSKCLLAVFLLALVAGIFIVITAVLATLLWRQKRAYKMNQHNHTEMVCISSLLADEAEEAGGRHPRVRRAKMLGDNASEAEMDSLTLNSFLPDH